MKAKNLFALATLIALICVLFSPTTATTKTLSIEGQAHAANLSKSVPSQLNYEGYLADATDSSAVTATLAMTFRIFDTETKGAELWSETHPAVEVNNGIFYALLGSAAAFPAGLFDGSTRWLQTEVGTEVLSPRKPLVSVAYSLRADEADHATQADDAGLLEGQSLTDLDSRWVNQGDLDHLDASDGDPASALSVDDAGKVGIGTASPLTELEVSGSVTATTYYGDGSNLTGISGTPDGDWTISGSHMYSAVPGSVGIGTTSPTKLLDVAGEVKATTYYGDGSNLTGISGTTDNDWTIDGDNIYRQTGKVGIGTVGPQRSLHLSSTTSSYGMLQVEHGDASPGEASIGFKDRLNADGSQIWVTGVGGWSTDSSFVIGRGAPKLLITPDAEVGIGTANPTEKLHVRGTDWATYVAIEATSGYAPGLKLNTDGSTQWRLFYHPTDSLISFWRESAGDRLVIKNNGNVGIGTSYPGSARLAVIGGSVGIDTYDPSQKLDVDMGNIIVQGTESCDAPGEEGIVYLGTVHHFIKGVYGFGVKIGTYAVGDSALTIRELSGKVGIGTTTPDERLHVRGTVKCDVLKLTGGADIAEPFEVQRSDVLTPGMVATIDPNHPGELKIADQAYDRCVAGIISGAGGIDPGLLMNNTRSTTKGEYPIALTGRVYCWADASDESIQPGDLLTTSGTPGHAMKVTDHARAQGAVIGKAMSSLEDGRGLVLVLVTLQ